MSRLRKILEFNDGTASEVPVVVSFLRSNAAAIVATLVDFGVLAFLRELFGFKVLVATVIGFLAGTIVNFLLTRNWAFKRKDGHLTKQAQKFLITAGIGLVLNTFGVWLLVEWWGEAYYLFARGVTAVLVGFFYSFFMYRYFVFK